MYSAHFFFGRGRGAITFDWVEIQEWFNPLEDAKNLLLSAVHFCSGATHLFAIQLKFDVAISVMTTARYTLKMVGLRP